MLIKVTNHIAQSCAAPAHFLHLLICCPAHVLLPRPLTFRAVTHRLHGIVIFSGGLILYEVKLFEVLADLWLCLAQWYCYIDIKH